MKRDYSLPKLKIPKDKNFEKMSKSNLSLNGKLKDPFDKIKKDLSDVGQPYKPRAASKRSVKQFK